ncbi:MAG: acyl-CoA dehydrogenase [Chloroflexi bacterium]|nr:MAG: acyl-CoA dehydrogenase [Chloroflexota bacterium]TMG50866.1 MAG: acyl-CoA dehydrogenase [Chloroflexota bacterium]
MANVATPRSHLFAPDHEEFRGTVRRFIEKEVRPHVDEWEQAQQFPRELFRRCGALDLLGLKYREQFGGTNAGVLYEAVLFEELARCGSGGVAAGIGAHVAIATPPINDFGDQAQLQRWLAPAIKGEKIVALGVTEPSGGSDIAHVQTMAGRQGDAYVVNGAKMFITNGVNADLVVILARTKPEGGHHGLSLLVVERGTPGYTVGRKLDKLGWRASDTAELVFQDCRVPVENRLGEENNGFKMAVANFQWERLWIAISAVASAQRSLELAVDYASNRVQFGKTLTSMQVIRHEIADMALRIEQARQLTYYALWLHSQNLPCTKEVSMAKIAATEADVSVADRALQIHGGYGYMMEYPIQRAWRDARLGPIGAGTNEIMREIIAKELDL